MIDTEDEIEFLKGDLNNARIEIINLRAEVRMLQGMVNGLQEERKDRERSLSRELLSLLEKDPVLTNYLETRIKELADLQMQKAKQTLAEKADSI